MHDHNHRTDIRNRRIIALSLVFGLGLVLRTSELQSEFFSTTIAAPHRLSASLCPVPRTMITLQIAALSRDIGRRFHVAQSAAHGIADAAYTAALRRGIDPALVLAVAAVESKFKPLAVNASTGATGLMQIVPKWHPDKVVGVGGEPSLQLIAPNIAVGAAILAEYVNAENGDVAEALGHYLGTAGADRYVNRVRLERDHFRSVLRAI